MTNSRLFVVALVPAFIAGCQALPTTTAARTPTPAQTFQVWSEEPGRRLAPADFGLPEESVDISDPVVTQLPDGRLRMYLRAGSRPTAAGGAPKLHAAVSSDGLHWVVESGLRCSEFFCGVGLPDVVALPSGGWRLFFNTPYAYGQPAEDTVIASATTQDGLNLIGDAGFRVRGRDFGLPRGLDFGAPRVVPAKEGGWRMYLSVATQDVGPSAVFRVFSAHSTDLMNWIPDTGVRMEGLNRPFIVSRPDGSFEALAGNFGYGNAPLQCTCVGMLTSPDGLTWSSPKLTGIVGGDLIGYSMPDGQLRVLYDDGDIWAPETTGMFSARLVTTTWGASIDRAPDGALPIIGPTHVTLKFIGSGPPITVRVVDRSHQLVRNVPGLPITVKPPATVQFKLEQQAQIKADQLILVTDGTVIRFFESQGQALSDCGGGILCKAASSNCGAGPGQPCSPTNCGPGTGTPCPPTNCGPGTGTPCPPTNCGPGTGSPCSQPNCGPGPGMSPCPPSAVGTCTPGTACPGQPDNCGPGQQLACPSPAVACQKGQPIPTQGCVTGGYDGKPKLCMPKGIDPNAPVICQEFY
jgi:hypothetical protein